MAACPSRVSCHVLGAACGVTACDERLAACLDDSMPRRPGSTSRLESLGLEPLRLEPLRLELARLELSGPRRVPRRGARHASADSPGHPSVCRPGRGRPPRRGGRGDAERLVAVLRRRRGAWRPGLTCVARPSPRRPFRRGHPGPGFRAGESPSSRAARTPAVPGAAGFRRSFTSERRQLYLVVFRVQAPTRSVFHDSGRPGSRPQEEARRRVSRGPPGRRSPGFRGRPFVVLGTSLEGTPQGCAPRARRAVSGREGDSIEGG
ncbi:MAG: hypothetical protein HMLKMBBP_03501 [Planctomycetes bacterium]|nr:hypothetical protein [Planctomycetota bacterium]